MNRFRRKLPSYNYMMILCMIILAGAFITTLFSKSSAATHPAYTGSDKIETTAGSEEIETTADTYTYTDETYGYSLQIPAAWRQLTKEDIIYFTDQESSASLKITGENYYPSVNSMSMETASQNIVDAGMTFVNFTRAAETQYELIYQDIGNTTYDYIDEVFWTRSDILTLQFVCKDDDYESVSADFSEILDSFLWETDDSVPSGYTLYYCDTGSYEIGIPSSWSTGINESSIVSTDTETGTTLTVTAEGNTDPLGDMTSLDAANLLNQGQQDFILQSFTASEKEADAFARYYSGETGNYIDTLIISNGQYQYSISFEYPEGALSDADKSSIKKMFREFLS